MADEKLVCDRCGQTYTDQGSIDQAKRSQKKWEEMIEKDSGEKARGIGPCPIIGCTGEMVLKEE